MTDTNPPPSAPDGLSRDELYDMLTRITRLAVRVLAAEPSALDGQLELQLAVIDGGRCSSQARRSTAQLRLV